MGANFISLEAGNVVHKMIEEYETDRGTLGHAFFGNE